jgi:hypothetical protein
LTTFPRGIGQRLLRILLGEAGYYASVIRRMPTASLRNVRDGEIVRLVGKLGGVPELLVAPLTRRPCAHYQVTVEEEDRNGRSREIFRETRLQDFQLVDPSGARSMVYTDHALFLVKPQATIHSGTLLPAPSKELEEFAAARGIQLRGVFFRHALVFRETVLLEGTLIAVGGTARWEPDPEPGSAGYRETPMRLVLVGGSSEPLIISDDPSR